MRYLGGPPGLAWRLQRNLLLAWVAGFAVLGAALGGAAQNVEEQVGGSPRILKLLAQLGGASTVVDSFFAATTGILALGASVSAIQAALRLHSEESGQHVEPLLATVVGRLRRASGHPAFAFLGPALALAAAGLTTGLSYGLTSANVGGEFPRVLAGALVQLPAVWVTAAVAVAFFGLPPRLAAFTGWAALAALVLVGPDLGGVALGLTDWSVDISPFAHVPKVPGEKVYAAPLISLAAVAVALTVVGLVGLLKKRDVA